MISAFKILTQVLIYPEENSMYTRKMWNLLFLDEMPCKYQSAPNDPCIIYSLCFLFNFLSWWSVHCCEWYIRVPHYYCATVSSVQFSRSVVSHSLRPHASQHARPPCPSPTPGAHSNSCPLSRWCHPAISSSVVPFSSCPQSLPASESFPMSQFFAWGGQSTGVSA